MTLEGTSRRRGVCNGRRVRRPRFDVINGPNLNLLGTRQPDIYGRANLKDVEALCREEAESAGADLVFRQSNAEHEIVEWLHDAGAEADGIVINPAAFGYSSYAIVDALQACPCPAIEVHISNIYARSEPWRGKSLISRSVMGVISGLGIHGYAAAIRHLIDLINSAALPGPAPNAGAER